MKNLKLRKEVRTTEEKEVTIPEVSYKKDSMETFMIDASNEQLLIKGIMFEKKNRKLTLELYPEKALFDILEKEDATEAEWNTELAKVQELLKNY